MDVVVSQHAIKRYRKRTFDFNQSDEEVEAMLARVVQKGEILSRRPGDVWELKYRDIYVVADIDNESNKVTVITCLGDRLYRSWAKKKEIMPRYSKREVV